MKKGKNLPYIYKLTDTRNGNMYIGKHNGKRKDYFTGGLIPNSIIKKHGKKVFKKEIIIQGDFTPEELNAAEIFYISWFDTYKNKRHYNLTDGGDGVRYENNPIALRKLKKSLKEYYKENDVWNKGKKTGHIPWNKDKKWTEEEKEKSLYNRQLSRQRKILQYSTNGDFIKEWKSGGECSRKLNIDKSSIHHCAQGKGKSARGFIFLYKEDVKNNPTLIMKRVILYNNRHKGKGLGRKFTKEEKIKQSKTAKKHKIHENFFKNFGGEPWNKGSNRSYKLESKRIKIAQIDINTNEIIKIWDCIEETENTLGINNIAAVCKGKYGRKSAGGFKWKYLSDIEDDNLNLKHAS